MVSHNTQKVSDRMEYILYLYVRDTPQCSEGEPYEQPQTQSAGIDGASCEVWEYAYQKYLAHGCWIFLTSFDNEPSETTADLLRFVTSLVHKARW